MLDKKQPKTYFRKSPRMKPVDFGQPVSPRLTAHCFLHGLLRDGYGVKASKYAELMIAQGIRIRTSTMESIISSLSPKVPVFLNGPRPPLRRSRRALNNTCTQAAIHLLAKARENGQQRTARMYESIISGTLMQGEIIVASLLFAVLVKDWQLRKALVESCQESDSGGGGTNKVHRYLLSCPTPILKEIHASLSRDPQGSMDDSYLVPALQALANLAMLWDTGQIPFGSITPLIRSLYCCPKTNQHVWILRDDQPTQVKAYPYFHSSLKKDAVWPPLDRHSYNTLLFYALRHRYSPAYASSVLEHMCVKRNPPLLPDIVTYNILIRSGTLLRQTPITDAALTALRLNQMNLKHGITVKPRVYGLAAPPTRSRSSQYYSSRFSKELQRLSTETLKMPDVARLAPPGVRADAFTLSSYVAHLTSTGTPEIVADVLFYILPELFAVDHPSWGSLTLEEHRALRKSSRREYMLRAVEYGPRVFAAIINALAKAGRTGLAERVWILAKRAERASWIPGFAPGVAPWCLSVHAYTSMLQCYAAEARKGLTLRRRRVHHLAVGETEGDQWKPRSSDHVRGWAHFILTRRKIRARTRLSRHAAAQLTGKLLFESMESGGQDIYEPDARFFNAALDLFGRRANMHARRQRCGPERWRRNLRIANRWFEQRGTMSRNFSPMLQRIGEAIIAAGYSVPPGFRHLFVGHWPEGSHYREERHYELDRRPLIFPPLRYSWRPHAIPTAKTRGLPLGRNRRPARR
ncbi:hypothetical protein B0H21DRAFT_776953 [Amylocystis lapponica]|nr:hypothetical protein B0H21DRAFT_776953 [Amylocystis lapponica]